MPPVPSVFSPRGSGRRHGFRSPFAGLNDLLSARRSLSLLRFTGRLGLPTRLHLPLHAAAKDALKPSTHHPGPLPVGLANDPATVPARALRGRAGRLAHGPISVGDDDLIDSAHKAWKRIMKRSYVWPSDVECDLDGCARLSQTWDVLSRHAALVALLADCDPPTIAPRKLGEPVVGLHSRGPGRYRLCPPPSPPHL